MLLKAKRILNLNEYRIKVLLSPHKSIAKVRTIL